MTSAHIPTDQSGRNDQRLLHAGFATVEIVVESLKDGFNIGLIPVHQADKCT